MKGIFLGPNPHIGVFQGNEPMGFREEHPQKSGLPGLTGSGDDNGGEGLQGLEEDSGQRTGFHDNILTLNI
jgi:hypothetical protein